jgi:hypothetical protein
MEPYATFERYQNNKIPKQFIQNKNCEVEIIHTRRQGHSDWGGWEVTISGKFRWNQD